MTEGVDGDSRSEIQISLAILSEEVGALATDEGDIRPVIGGKQSREHWSHSSFLAAVRLAPNALVGIEIKVQIEAEEGAFICFP
jgi:hypothetical protein